MRSRKSASSRLADGVRNADSSRRATRRPIGTAVLRWRRLGESLAVRRRSLFGRPRRGGRAAVGAGCVPEPQGFAKKMQIRLLLADKALEFGNARLGLREPVAPAPPLHSTPPADPAGRSAPLSPSAGREPTNRTAASDRSRPPRRPRPHARPLQTPHNPLLQRVRINPSPFDPHGSSSEAMSLFYRVSVSGRTPNFNSLFPEINSLFAQLGNINYKPLIQLAIPGAMKARNRAKMTNFPVSREFTVGDRFVGLRPPPGSPCKSVYFPGSEIARHFGTLCEENRSLPPFGASKRLFSAPVPAKSLAAVG